MLVCRNCFGESATLDAKFEKSDHTNDCPTCGSTEVRLLDTDDLAEVFRPLHEMYEVAEHGKHYLWDSEDRVPLFDSRCDDLLAVIQNDWGLFSDDIQDATQRELLAALWPDWDETSQYSSEHMWEEYADAVWERLSHRVRHERRFFPPVADHPYEVEDIDRDLGHYIDECESFNHTGAWVRARLGQWRVAQMGAPPPECVKRGGRANPAGIAYLYLASNEETALAEVRAEPGNEVTLAKFEIEETARIADLTDLQKIHVDPLGHESLKYEINRRGLLRRFADTLSRPVTDDEHEIDYVPTQYLAEFFLTRKFDGICFSSSLASSGKNIVLFDPQKGSICSHIVHVRVASKKLTWVVQKPRLP